MVEHQSYRELLIAELDEDEDLINNFAKMRDAIRDIMIAHIENGIQTIDVPEKKIQFH
jgi:hypothetical protein